MGGKISSCHKIAKAIWEWAIERNLWLMAAHIPGKENVHADTLSRSLTVNTEWELSMETFIKVKEHYPDLNFDLFASRLNFKLSRYASWLPDPTAETVDAFTMNWDTIFKEDTSSNDQFDRQHGQHQSRGHSLLRCGLDLPPQLPDAIAGIIMDAWRPSSRQKY